MHYPPSVRLSPRTPYGARELLLDLGGPVAAESALRYATDDRKDLLAVHERFVNEYGHHDRTDFKTVTDPHEVTPCGYVLSRMSGTRYAITGWYKANREYRAAVYLTPPLSRARDAFLNPLQYCTHNSIFGPVVLLVHAVQPRNDLWRCLGLAVGDRWVTSANAGRNSKKQLHCLLAALTYPEIEVLTTEDPSTLTPLQLLAEGGLAVDFTAQVVADTFFTYLTDAVRRDMVDAL